MTLHVFLGVVLKVYDIVTEKTKEYDNKVKKMQGEEDGVWGSNLPAGLQTNYTAIQQLDMDLKDINAVKQRLVASAKEAESKHKQHLKAKPSPTSTHALSVHPWTKSCAQLRKVADRLKEKINETQEVISRLTTERECKKKELKDTPGPWGRALLNFEKTYHIQRTAYHGHSLVGNHIVSLLNNAHGLFKAMKSKLIWHARRKVRDTRTHTHNTKQKSQNNSIN
jgi:hypothetical protein